MQKSNILQLRKAVYLFLIFLYIVENVKGFPKLPHI